MFHSYVMEDATKRMSQGDVDVDDDAKAKARAKAGQVALEGKALYASDERESS